MRQVDAWQLAAASPAAETTSRQTMLDAALPDFERVVE
jgi:hypothetical protein